MKRKAFVVLFDLFVGFVAIVATQSVDPALQNAKLDLKAVYTNDFVRKANAKYPKG